ncbi:hypothetical protein NDU88_009924 [Pleurodeles waltl]|uniref:Uncharacterized protein n=1 Tax=Pleurodeles waltl TaxID=8319 RepID=A0AAV7PWL3_PLEWA|nr:hypothetical protein NDU88_009924 [Pleurodeles waltl]
MELRTRTYRNFADASCSRARQLQELHRAVSYQKQGLSVLEFQILLVVRSLPDLYESMLKEFLVRWHIPVKDSV